jgi:hypothetical protein
MKSLLLATLLSCALYPAQAGSNYIYDQNTGRVLGYFSANGYLYDQQTGRALGFIQGGYLYASNGEAIGYLQNGYLYSAKTGQVLGYLQGNGNCDSQ